MCMKYMTMYTKIHKIMGYPHYARYPFIISYVEEEKTDLLSLSFVANYLSMLDDIICIPNRA